MLKSFARHSLVAAAFGAILCAAPTHAQQAPGPTRTVLLRHDTTPGYEMVLVRAEIPVGGREGRHTHPGAVMVFVEQGTISLDYEGKARTEYKAGESFFVEEGKIHEGINTGSVPAKALATFYVKKGATLTTQVK